MEANWETCQPCSFSLFQIGGWTPDDPATKIIEIPHLLSILATGDPDGQVLGINEVQQQYTTEFPQNGEVQYYPNVFVQYWSMRAMAYLAGLGVARRPLGRLPPLAAKLDSSRFFQRVATWTVLIPFVMGTAGWVLTENGRQPWLVQGLMLTRDGLSPSVSTAEVAISLVVFLLLYAAIGVIALVLMLRHVRSAPADDATTDDTGDRVPELTY